jgi:hypothetical protein
VLDGLDRVGVSEALRDFVEYLIGEVIANNLPNLIVILLGYGPLSHLNFSDAIAEETLLPLCRGDVRTFFRDIAKIAELELSDSELDQEADAVMEGIPAKMDRPAMDEIATRVRHRSETILKKKK